MLRKDFWGPKEVIPTQSIPKWCVVFFVFFPSYMVDTIFIPYQFLLGFKRNFTSKIYVIEFPGIISPNHRPELNRDGRPSGFARVIFESEEAVGECCCCVGYNGRCKDPRKSRDKRMNRTYNF